MRKLLGLSVHFWVEGDFFLLLALPFPLAFLLLREPALPFEGLTLLLLLSLLLAADICCGKSSPQQARH